MDRFQEPLAYIISDSEDSSLGSTLHSLSKPSKTVVTNKVRRAARDLRSEGALLGWQSFFSISCDCDANRRLLMRFVE